MKTKAERQGPRNHFSDDETDVSTLLLKTTPSKFTRDAFSWMTFFLMHASYAQLCTYLHVFLHVGPAVREGT